MSVFLKDMIKRKSVSLSLLQKAMTNLKIECAYAVIYSNLINYFMSLYCKITYCIWQWPQCNCITFNLNYACAK